MSEKPKEERRHKVEDVEDLREVLKAVRSEVPGLLKDITGPLKELMTLAADEKQAKERAKAIAVFYKELVAGGISEEAAMKMTEQQFASPVSILEKLASSGRRIEIHKRHHDEEKD
jgi:hypothetical protein